jgi:hypothetical protein
MATILAAKQEAEEEALLMGQPPQQKVIGCV